MITITHVLQVGKLVYGSFEESEEYDLEDDEDINTILNVSSDPIHTDARLIVHCTGMPDQGMTLGIFKKTKVQTKKGLVYRWVVVE